MKEQNHILIVEDDAAIAALVASILRPDRGIISTAHSIKETEEALAKGPVDIIILDRLLPDGDGLELFQKLRTNPEFRHVPVLVISGKASPQDQADGLDLGADDYVTKPFSAQELHARVHALLRRAGKFAD